MKRFFCVLLCCFLFLQAVPSALAENRTVKAGVFFFDGYHMAEDDGSYTGFGIEFLGLVSRYSHLNFDLVGMDGHVAKPIDVPVPMETLATILRQRGEEDFR